MRLAEHRSDAAHLHHQPLDGLPAALTAAAQRARLVREIEQDRARLHQREAGIVIDDRGNLVVRAHAQELSAELLVRIDVDCDHAIRQPDFLEHDRDLAAVRRRPRVEIDHAVRPVTKLARFYRRSRLPRQARRRVNSRRPLRRGHQDL
jgi:hypothetical protein